MENKIKRIVFIFFIFFIAVWIFYPLIWRNLTSISILSSINEQYLPINNSVSAKTYMGNGDQRHLQWFSFYEFYYFGQGDASSSASIDPTILLGFIKNSTCSNKKKVDDIVDYSLSSGMESNLLLHTIALYFDKCNYHQNALNTYRLLMSKALDDDQIKSSSIYYRMSVLLLNLEPNQDELIESYLLKALSEDHFVSDIEKSYANCDLGWYLFKKGFTARSVDFLEIGSQMNDANHWCNMHLLLAQYKENGNIQEFENKFLQLIVNWPEDQSKAYPYKELSLVYKSLGYIDKAKETKDKALKYSDDLANEFDY